MHLTLTDLSAAELDLPRTERYDGGEHGVAAKTGTAYGPAGHAVGGTREATVGRVEGTLDSDEAVRMWMRTMRPPLEVIFS